ncbi:hypothetical protein SD467_001312 [Vibrio parahaemolyticus]|nr:hypothetical protein [Vibrio parahaemolyticus]
MRNTWILSLFMFVMACPTFAVARDVATSEIRGKVNYLQVHKDPTDASNKGQRFIVNLDSQDSVITCGESGYWTGTLDTEGGRAIYSAVLSAAMADKEIVLQGNSENTCLSGNMLIRNVLFVY